MSRRFSPLELEGWLRRFPSEEQIPPYCVELVLRDRNRHFVACGYPKINKEADSITLRIWDMRAVSDERAELLKKRINESIRSGKVLTPEDPETGLDWANIRLEPGSLLYCIEWHQRFWPHGMRDRIGFCPRKETD
jgi:hypothetical protein